jgi:predicted ABC-type ATPase
MPYYNIIAGVNGVGKSSFSGAVIPSDPELFGKVIDVDKLASEEKLSAIQAGKIASKMILDCIEKKENFTQETTLSGAKTLATIKLAKAQGYTVRLFYIGLDTAAESLERIKNRVRYGGHNIPQSDVKRRFLTRQSDLLKVVPLCDFVEFYTNTNGFELIASGCVKQNNIFLYYRYDKKTENPLWFEEFVNGFKSEEASLN